MKKVIIRIQHQRMRVRAIPRKIRTGAQRVYALLEKINASAAAKRDGPGAEFGP
jgi:hypothetical protein